MGRNNNGQLGLGHTTDTATPTRVVTPTVEVVYYAKPTDTLNTGSVHTLSQTLSDYLTKPGYIFYIYSHQSYAMTSELLLSDQVGMTARTIYVKYELAP